MDGHAEALIDLAAVARNVEAMREHVRGTPLMAVVKADGYGHGMIPAAHAAVAGGAQWLGVVHEHEALALRQAGLTTRVLTLLGAPGAAHEAAIREDVDLTVDAVPLLHEVAAAATRAGRPARVHLKVDTGMARGGATPASWLALVARRPVRRGRREHHDYGDMVPSGLRGHTWTSIRRRPAGPVHRRGHAGRSPGSPARGAPPGQHRGGPGLPGYLVRPGPPGRRDLRPGHHSRGRAGLAPPGDDGADPADPGQARPGRHRRCRTATTTPPRARAPWG